MRGLNYKLDVGADGQIEISFPVYRGPIEIRHNDELLTNAYSLSDLRIGVSTTLSEGRTISAKKNETYTEDWSCPIRVSIDGQPINDPEYEVNPYWFASYFFTRLCIYVHIASVLAIFVFTASSDGLALRQVHLQDPKMWTMLAFVATFLALHMWISKRLRDLLVGYLVLSVAILLTESVLVFRAGLPFFALALFIPAFSQARWFARLTSENESL